MSRAYLRVDPAMFERKVMQQAYPSLAYAALNACLQLGVSQPVRGRFRDERVLRALLGPLARQVGFLLERRDLIPAVEHPHCKDCPTGHGAPGQLYIDGWDEWQEGDWTVKDRMSRVRNKNRNGDRNPDRIPTVPAGRGEAVSEAGRPTRYTDAYKAFEDVRGVLPDGDEKRWIDELCRDMGRENVARAMYDLTDPAGTRFLGRLSKILRGAA